MNDFYKAYSQITGYTPEKVKDILEIQDKQETKYSRVKTCKELWDIQQVRIDKLESLLREAVMILDKNFEYDYSGGFDSYEELVNCYLNKPEIKEIMEREG